MASIRRRTLASGKVAYLVRWVDPGGHERAKQHARHEDAKRHKTELESQLHRGAYVEPSRLTFREYAEQWRALQVHRSTTVTRVERDLRLHAYPVIGDRRIGLVRRSEIQSLVKGLRLSPGSVSNVYTTVSSVFAAAVLDRLIHESPCQRIALPKGTKREVVIPDDVFALAERVPERLRRLVLVAAGTGLRQGELAGLAVESVDFLRRTLSVHPDHGQLVSAESGDPFLAPPKTAASVRDIPLAPSVVSLLSEQIATYGTVEYQGRHLIFTNTQGNPLRRATFTERIGPVLRAAGYPKGTGMHLFRHFYASTLIAREPNLKVVQVRMGHSSITETYDTYGHLLPDSDDLSRQAVEDVFRAQKKPPASEETGG